MSEIFQNSITIGLTISLLAYGLGVLIKKKLKHTLFNPLLISILLVIAFLVIFDVKWEIYNESAKYLGYLLTPATVSLAIPLYQKLELLKKDALAITLGISAGVLSSALSVLSLSYLFGLVHDEYVTFLSKSITTAIAIGLTEELGGFITITIASIMVTGLMGNMIAESLYKWIRVKHPVAKGLGIGVASHAMGTSKAMEMGETEGAMSSLAIVVAGLVTVLVAPIFAQFY